MDLPGPNIRLEFDADEEDIVVIIPPKHLTIQLLGEAIKQAIEAVQGQLGNEEHKH